MNIELKIEKLHIDVIRPSYHSDGAAGMDLHAYLDGWGSSPVIFQPWERKLINTGLKMQIPVGYEGQIRTRSGLALNDGLVVANSPGTIDSDYRGEIKVLLINLSQNVVCIEFEERIAQLVIAPVVKAKLIEVESLDETERGEGGFGSTGT
jgi:dUTP pyrophosphatase